MLCSYWLWGYYVQEMENSISCWWKIEERQKGWSEKESDNPFWEGEIENKLPNGFGTYTHTNGTTYVGQYVDGLREGNGTWTLFDGSKFLENGKIIEDGTENQLIKKEMKSENL